MRGGWVGVDGFFVLSGFLIGSLLVDEQRRTGTIAYLRFLTRRLLRLWPALWVVLAAIVVTARLVDETPWRDLASSTLATVGFYLNWTLTHGGGGQPVEWFGHLWSLGPEFQFYVVTPFVLLALHRLRAPRWTWVVLFGALAVGSALWRREVWLHGSGYPAAYVDTHLRLDSFLLGVVAALLITWQWLDLRWRWPLRLAGLAGVGYLGWVITTQNYLVPWLYTKGGLFLCAVASVAIILWVAVESHGPAARLLSTTPLVAAGRRSYSIYLWHFPVVLLVADQLPDWGFTAKLALSVAVTVALSELSYRGIERPGIALSRRFVARTATPPPSPARAASEPTPVSR